WEKPRRSNDAPPDKREAETPHKKRRRAVRLAQPLAEREVQREDECIHRGERKADRVELAESGVVRTSGEEASNDGKSRGDPQSPADRPPAQPRVDQQEDRPGVLDDERHTDWDALDRLVVDEGYAREADDPEDSKERKIRSADA